MSQVRVQTSHSALSCCGWHTAKGNPWQGTHVQIKDHILGGNGILVNNRISSYVIFMREENLLTVFMFHQNQELITKNFL